MQINKRFYIFLLIAFISLAGWLVTFDNLLLSLWLINGLMLASAYGIAKFSLEGVEVKRIAHIKKLEVGKIFDERIEISNQSRFRKLWLQIEDQSKILSEIHSRTFTNLGAGWVRMHQALAVVNKRGFYPLGPTRLVSGDPFGIFTTSKMIPPANQLTVYPHMERIPLLKLLPGEEIGGQNLILPTTRTTPQAAGVREYLPGDPLNRIHWPITVKKDKLMVKDFDEDTQSCVWLFLDAQKGLYPHQSDEIPPAVDWNLLPLKKKAAYRLPKDGFEYAVSIAASIADFYLRSNLAVGFAVHGQNLNILPAEKGQRQLHKILDNLASLEDEGDMPVQVLIERQLRNISRGSALVIITTRDQTAMNLSVRMAHRRGLSALVIQIDSNSFSAEPEISQRDESKRVNVKNLIRIAYGDDIPAKLSQI